MRAAVHPINSSVIRLLTAHGITISALVPLGASVRGLDLRQKPSEEVVNALQTAMATRGFLVFKDQGVLSGDEQVAASELWGGRKMHSTHGVHPESPNKHIFRLSNDQQVGCDLDTTPLMTMERQHTRGKVVHYRDCSWFR
jgi:taurine dioxygenase